MTRARRGARRPPAEPTNYPPAFPDAAAILVEAEYVRKHIRWADVGDADVEDLMQEVALRAVRAIERGLYRPNPRMEPRLALRRWLRRIAIRQLLDFRKMAHRRREVVSWDSWWQEHEAAEPLDPQSDASEALAVLEALPPWARELLVLVAEGLTYNEIAKLRGMPWGTVATRIHRARLAALLKRRKRRAKL